MSVLKYLNDTQTARLWAKIKAGFVAKSGDTMTGALTLAGDPVSDLQAATKKYVDDNAGALPSQTGQSGKFLTTDGTDASWGEVDALPSQTGKSGKFLTTDGTDASWEDVDSLPSQTGQSGKYLTTNGTSASWGTVDALPSQSGKNGKYLKTNGTAASWEDVPAQTAKIWTGYCTTAADTAAKVVTLDDPTGFTLKAGNMIAVEFVYGMDLSSGTTPTMNVNETGAKGLYVPSGWNSFSRNDVGKFACATQGTCLFSYQPGLSSGAWVLETSGLLLSKAYDTADAALPKAGGTMTGALTLSGAPTSDLHAATKKYVDDSIPEVPTKVSDLTNDAGYITGYTETDPTVPSWAKQSSKPSYTAAEVGAVPTTRTVNGKALSSDITLSASDVSALPSSTTIPTASTTNPSMDGTASYGSGTSYARSNHVHPTDTSRQAKITASGLLKGDGSGGVSAATAGTDYAAASHSHGNITSGGDITATAPTIASGDQLVINDNSASKITNGPTFDGSTTTKALTPKGTWETFLTLATLPIYDGGVS